MYPYCYGRTLQDRNEKSLLPCHRWIGRKNFGLTPRGLEVIAAISVGYMNMEQKLVSSLESRLEFDKLNILPSCVAGWMKARQFADKGLPCLKHFKEKGTFHCDWSVFLDDLIAGA
jgi:hypothetical protein